MSLVDTATHRIHFYPARRWNRVLELSSFDGRDTVLLAPQCCELVVVEGRPQNIERTHAAVQAAGLHNVTYHQANIEGPHFGNLGRFDCVLAWGVLYHLPRPWEAIGRITTITDLCVGWTHLAEAMTTSREGWWGREYQEQDSDLSGFSAVSFWLAPHEFLRAWQCWGWTAEFTTPPTPHRNGGFAAEFVCRARHPLPPSPPG